MEKRSWPAEWLRGALTPAVLAIIAEGQTYGYLIAQRLEEGGLGTVKGGTLYPLLTRLEHDGDIVATWREGSGGPGRKYYAISPSGIEHLRTLRRDWRAFSTNASALITGSQEDE